MKKLLIVVAAAFTFAAAKQAMAQSVPPVRVQLAYNGNTAKLQMRFRFNRARRSECRVRVMGGISYPGDTEFEKKRLLIEKRFTNRKSFTLNAEELEGVENNEDGEQPILSIQGRLICNQASINEYSESVARFVNCGVSRQDVSPNAFLRALSLKLKDDAADIQ
jgi:hypothetical protein